MDKYESVGKLGQGNFGIVTLAKHLKTDEMVAIKHIEKKGLKRELLPYIENQIKISKQAAHQNIIKTYQVFQDSNDYHIVMEYLSEGDLLNGLRKNGPFPVEQAFLFFAQILAALEHLHQKKIAHRDIKLANILISGQNVKIIDFGLSAFYQETLETSCGSPCFAAPEVLIGNQYDPKAADIWSLGVVLYTMLEASLPFYHNNIKDLHKQVQSGNFHFPKRMQRSSLSLIRKMLHPNPQKRITFSQIRNYLQNLNLPIPYSGCKVSVEDNQEKKAIITSILIAQNFRHQEVLDFMNGKKEKEKNELNVFYELLSLKSLETLKQMKRKYVKEDNKSVNSTICSVKNLKKSQLVRRISRSSAGDCERMIKRKRTLDEKCKRLVKRSEEKHESNQVTYIKSQKIMSSFLKGNLTSERKIPGNNFEKFMKNPEGNLIKRSKFIKNAHKQRKDQLTDVSQNID